jgi:branched-chain amino acid transport system permease protein
MSAANWRRAMNVQTPRPVASGRSRAGVAQEPRRRRFTNPVRPHHVIVLAFLLAFPWFATPFFTFQIGAQTLALGLIALSLTFLAGSGGMISLAQMTVAGIAGYMVAIFGSAAADGASLGWPWWLAVLLGIVIAVAAAAFIGWLSVRTEGIYTIMITLAIGVAFYYLALQNYAVFNGFQGKQQVFPPTLAGVYWRDPTPFYYLALACALAGYLFVVYLLRTPFGIACKVSATTRAACTPSAST